MRRACRPAPTPQSALGRTSIRMESAPAPANPLTGHVRMPPRPGGASPRARSARRPAAASLGAALCLLLGSASLADAGPVYKIIDAEGRVSYSASPPAGDGQRVEQVRIRGAQEAPPAAPPTDNLLASSQARARAVAEAQQGLIRAKADLEQAKIQGKDDWLTQPGGNRVLTAAYLNRVAAAEAEVEKAERALAKARQTP